MIDIVVEKDWVADEVYRNFVLAGSDNGTFFHLPEFLNYHEDHFFKDTEKYLIKFVKQNKLIAGIAGVIKKEQAEDHFISPFGASYGGLVVSKGLVFDEYEMIYDLLLSWLRPLVKSVKIIPTTVIHSISNMSFYNDFILLSKGFQVIKTDLLLVHELADNDLLFKRLDKKTATELNQPLKKNDLRLQIINGVDDDTYALLLASQQRLGSTPTHSFRDLSSIHASIPQVIKTFKVSFEEQLLAGIICFTINEKVLNSFYIFDALEARQLKANHYAYYSVLRWAKENNFNYFDFGPSSFGYTPNYPLIKFKEKFDSRPFLRTTYQLNFN